MVESVQNNINKLNFADIEESRPDPRWKHCPQISSGWGTVSLIQYGENAEFARMQATARL